MESTEKNLDAKTHDAISVDAEGTAHVKNGIPVFVCPFHQRYVCKPFEVQELLSRVRAQLRIKDLNDNLKRANDRLKELIDIDDLTGLFNMRSLYKKLDFELDRGRRYNRSVCVIMMDLDHFKKVNDSNDHLFGSYVLTQVGRIIKSNTRNIDIPARYGGDESLS